MPIYTYKYKCIQQLSQNYTLKISALAKTTKIIKWKVDEITESEIEIAINRIRSGIEFVPDKIPIKYMAIFKKRGYNVAENIF